MVIELVRQHAEGQHPVERLGCPVCDWVRKESPMTKITWWEQYGYVIDLPSGRVLYAPTAEVADSLARAESKGMQVEWSERAEKQRRKERARCSR